MVQACEEGNHTAVIHLLASGANIHQKNVDEKSAMDVVKLGEKYREIRENNQLKYPHPEIRSEIKSVRDLGYFFWSKERHMFFPRSYRKRVETVLLCKNNKTLKIPKPILLMIISYM